MIDILSLGAGVQSSTILIMACLGDLPKFEHAIFADPGWEPAAVYRHLDVLEDFAGGYGIKIHRVFNRNIKTDALTAQVRGKKAEGQHWAALPYFTRQSDGKIGMIRRQCTSEYKIKPIHRKARELAGLKPGARVAAPVVRQWIGISIDESSRMRDPDNAWSVNYYPLIDLRMSRRDCLEYLELKGFSEVPKSACIGCPFHTDREWRRLKDTAPEEFEEACQFDEAIRNCGGRRGQMFLHSSGLPLREVDFSTAEERGQLNWLNECFGMCGV